MEITTDHRQVGERQGREETKVEGESEGNITRLQPPDQLPTCRMFNIKIKELHDKYFHSKCKKHLTLFMKSKMKIHFVYHTL